MIGVAPGTLRGAYRAELDDGLSHAVAGAATNMFRLWTGADGNHVPVVCTWLWCSVRDEAGQGRPGGADSFCG
jgi:hypothetical protein